MFNFKIYLNMEYTKKYKAYVLIDPTTNIPRYVGIT